MDSLFLSASCAFLKFCMHPNGMIPSIQLIESRRLFSTCKALLDSVVVCWSPAPVVHQPTDAATDTPTSHRQVSSRFSTVKLGPTAMTTAPIQQQEPPPSGQQQTSAVEEESVSVPWWQPPPPLDTTGLQEEGGDGYVHAGGGSNSAGMTTEGAVAPLSLIHI